jgi:nicotinamidase-related amidase
MEDKGRLTQDEEDRTNDCRGNEMSVSGKRLHAENSILVLVDVQDKLLAKMPVAGQLVRNAAFLLDAATLMQVSIRATEQYPKGLGATNAELLRRLPAPPLSKTTFSCCGAGQFLEDLQKMKKPNVVLIGMETHVCIAQTALDLLEAGLHVFLPVDTLGSRYSIDHETALRRLEQAGAVPTTAEAVAFEWTADASHLHFKAISRLVIDRSASA